MLPPSKKGLAIAQLTVIGRSQDRIHLILIKPVILLIALMLVNKYLSVSKEVCVQNKVDHSMDRVHVK